MAKKVYAIGKFENKLTTSTVNVEKETTRCYYLDHTCWELNFHFILKKAEEGLNWTTDKAKFPEIQQNYVNKVINAQKNKIIEAQDDLARLIEDAKRLGLKVEE